jgi:transcription elongation GreA/GreB family factor
MLHRRCVETVADPAQQRLALASIVAEDANLDQLVRQEIDVDFVQHRGREAVVADGDDRMERMRLGAISSTLGGC